MTDTLNTRLFVFVLSFLSLIGTVRADNAYPVLSYKCLRDEDKIRFDYEVLYNEAGRDFHYSESDGTYDPWKLVTTKEQNGFSAIVDIKKVERFCWLSSGNYKVAIEPSPGNHNLGGRCGAQMSAAVAVYRGEVEVLKKVSFEGDCHYSDDAITSITVLGSTGAVDIRYLSDSFALHKAVKKSDIQAIKVHLKKGANPNERDHNGKTPILLAVKSRNLPISELLIQGGAETQEALSIASSEGASEIVKVLLKSGVDVNGRNNPSHRGSALRLAAYGGHSEVVMDCAPELEIDPA